MYAQRWSYSSSQHYSNPLASDSLICAQLYSDSLLDSRSVSTGLAPILGDPQILDLSLVYSLLSNFLLLLFANDRMILSAFFIFLRIFTESILVIPLSIFNYIIYILYHAYLLQYVRISISSNTKIQY